MNIYDFCVTPFIENSFMLNALLACSLVSIVCAGVGVLMILRRMTFMSEAFGHGVLPGIAIAILLGFSTQLGSVLSGAVMIAIIVLIGSKSILKSDTAIGIAFVFMLALGVAIISASNSFSGDLTSTLFGETLGVSEEQLTVQLIGTIFILGIMYIFKRPLILMCISNESAKLSGFNPSIYNILILSLIAACIAISFQTVGTMLVVGMLIAPSAAALILSKQLYTSILIAAVFGIVGSYIGLLVSYYIGIAASPAIAITTAIIFFASLAIKR